MDNPDPIKPSDPTALMDLEMSDWPSLPEVRVASEVCASQQYGAREIAAAYCGLSAARLQIKGVWQHGWMKRSDQVDPRGIPGAIVENAAVTPVYVARKDEEDYLRANGYKNAKAIGMPISYLPDLDIKRRANTLLVMPVHSLDYVRTPFRFGEYVDAIDAISSRFDKVVVCIHPSCLRNGFWLNEFRNRGYPIIIGAEGRDVNGLKRVQSLFSQFEFVTTNGHGSLIPYAASFGAKVSVYGPFCEPQAADYEAEYLFQKNPGLLDNLFMARGEHVCRKSYPFLFLEPSLAKEHASWGRLEIGYDNRISPSGMRRIFEWRVRDRVPMRIRRASGWVLRHLRQKIREDLESRRDPTAEKRKIEFNRLSMLPRKTPGHTTIDEKRFHYHDPSLLAVAYKHIYLESCYDFPSVKAEPTIIDCGANIGIAVRYWLERFPKAKIIALEPDPELFRVLERNIRECDPSTVSLHQKAVWRFDGMLEFQSTELETGQVAEIAHGTDGKIISVASIRLSSLLNTDVDFLKIDIEGAEVDVLLESESKLECVKNICLEYHSFVGQPQRLDEMLGVLRRCGFRVHLTHEYAVANPLWLLQAPMGMDNRIIVWGYRGECFPKTEIV
jgi:FkbM family methyltransferase